jgi:hypothetical protein
MAYLRPKTVDRFVSSHAQDAQVEDPSIAMENHCFSGIISKFHPRSVIQFRPSSKKKDHFLVEISSKPPQDLRRTRVESHDASALPAHLRPDPLQILEFHRVSQHHAKSEGKPRHMAKP